jgi:hypothetical protein
VDVGRQRIVLDELYQVISINDLPGRGRQVLADFEGAVIAHANAELSTATLQVVEQVFKTLHEIFTAALERRAQDLGVGQPKVTRRHGVEHLIDIEINLMCEFWIKACGFLPHQLMRPSRGQQIGLFNEIKQPYILPILIEKSFICGQRGDKRLGVLALHPC